MEIHECGSLDFVYQICFEYINVLLKLIINMQNLQILRAKCGTHDVGCGPCYSACLRLFMNDNCNL